MNPIIKFESIHEAVSCMRQWMGILAITDWTIKLKLCEPHEFNLQDVGGECEFTPSIKAAIIRVLKPEYYGDRIIKYCAESILVHELLHCKFAMLDTDSDGFNKLLHQTQEDIARAFICAKYGIDIHWFDDIDYEE
jgi:hypothetical protein